MFPATQAIPSARTRHSCRQRVRCEFGRPRSAAVPGRSKAGASERVACSPALRDRRPSARGPRPFGRLNSTNPATQAIPSAGTRHDRRRRARRKNQPLECGRPRPQQGHPAQRGVNVTGLLSQSQTQSRCSRRICSAARRIANLDTAVARPLGAGFTA